MPSMVDPTDALTSFQKEYRRRTVHVSPGALDRKLFVHLDEPAPNIMRFTYVRLQGQTITAMAIFTVCEPIEGVPCFQAGIAVPPNYRGQGRAKDILKASISELQNGMARNGVKRFYIEGIVRADNVASQRVSEEVLSPTPNKVTDSRSGEPALQYLLRIEPSA